MNMTGRILTPVTFQRNKTGATKDVSKDVFAVLICDLRRSHRSQTDTDTKNAQNALSCYNLFNVKAATTC